MSCMRQITARALFPSTRYCSLIVSWLFTLYLRKTPYSALWLPKPKPGVNKRMHAQARHISTQAK